MMNMLKRTRSAFAATTLLAAAMGSVSAHSPAYANASQDTSQERNKQIVTEAFNRWQAGAGSFFDDVLAPDVAWTIEGSGPSAGTYNGQQDLMDRAVRPFTARLSGPVRPVSKKVWADGDHVIINWEGETTARDGRPYTNSYAWILRMEEGKAVEVTAFLDLVPYDDVFRRIPEPQTR